MSGIRTARERWRAAMPRFFRRIAVVAAAVSGTALAVNTAMTAAGAQPHEWWVNVYPYLVGVPAGMAFVAKFTREYGKGGTGGNGNGGNEAGGGTAGDGGF